MSKHSEEWYMAYVLYLKN